jgi:hypothetical protein
MSAEVKSESGSDAADCWLLAAVVAVVVVTHTLRPRSQPRNLIPSTRQRPRPVDGYTSYSYCCVASLQHLFQLSLQEKTRHHAPPPAPTLPHLRSVLSRTPLPPRKAARRHLDPGRTIGHRSRAGPVQACAGRQQPEYGERPILAVGDSGRCVCAVLSQPE